MRCIECVFRLVKSVINSKFSAAIVFAMASVCSSSVDCPDGDDEADCRDNCVSNTCESNMNCIDRLSSRPLCRCPQQGYQPVIKTSVSLDLICQGEKKKRVSLFDPTFSIRLRWMWRRESVVLFIWLSEYGWRIQLFVSRWIGVGWSKSIVPIEGWWWGKSILTSTGVSNTFSSTRFDKTESHRSVR